MYNEFAHLWPLISPPEDYAREARCWKNALRHYLGPGKHKILELGVGGGHNLSHLTGDYQATAVDLSPKMLENSRRLNPEVEHLVGDMRSVRLDQKFQAVIIHDAIDYMLTEQDLSQVFGTAAFHLNPEGVLITAPDYFKETFSDPWIEHGTNRDGSIELSYIEYSYDPDPEDTTIENILFYLIREEGKLKIEKDRHVTGLFSKNTWSKLIRQAGFVFHEWPCPPGGDLRQASLLIGVLKKS
ncbi:MAG: hypothetical protein APR63_08400 [Desulfuromonas sp. SDB]|nr:MAG: hypothetical protein APR63_08400 [Desulfuromonas sp. SDB]